MPDRSRREVLQAAAALGVLAGTTLGDELLQPAGSADKPKPADRWRGLKMGVASYSLRGLKLDAAITGIQRVAMTYVSIKDIHLQMKSTPDERKAVAAKF